MSRSLQRRLSSALAGAVLVSAFVAASASLVLAYGEAKEFQDDMLRQIAVLSDRAATSAAAGVAAEAGISDPESRVQVVRMASDSKPAWLSDGLTPGFHDVDAGPEPLRVFVREAAAGRIAVAQPTGARNEIAIDSALRTLVPLLALLPVLGWLIVRIVRSEFAPVTRAAKDLDQQPADRPRPIDDPGLPDEIGPFVQAINRLLERVNLLMAQQMRFIADAAHELRSPLTALAVQAQNLRHADSPQAMHERVVPLQAGIERARQLTEQLLSLSRVQAGPVDQAPIDVSALARELIAECLPRAEAKAIDLGLDERVRVVAWAVPQSLRLIFGNALDNALNYTPRGGEVTVRLTADDSALTVEVVDSGPGIAPAERERVFDAFYRIPGTAGTGSGLGLAIAREAAARLGGTVSLSERQDRPGLVFRYRQPMRR